MLAVETAGLRVIDLYVPNGCGPSVPTSTTQCAGSRRCEWLAAEQQRHPNLVVLGDFNIAPEDRDVHDPEGLEGGITSAPAEREALRALLGLGLVGRIPSLLSNPRRATAGGTTAWPHSVAITACAST